MSKDSLYGDMLSEFSRYNPFDKSDNTLKQNSSQPGSTSFSMYEQDDENDY